MRVKLSEVPESDLKIGVGRSQPNDRADVLCDGQSEPIRRRGREACGVRAVYRRFPNTLLGDMPRKAVLKHAHSKRFAPFRTVARAQLCRLVRGFARLSLTRMGFAALWFHWAEKVGPRLETSPYSRQPRQNRH
jgi:hypothetical protein